MELNQAINQLVNALANSTEFNNLRKATQDVKKNTQTKNAFDQFQQKQELLYSNKLSQGDMDKLMNELNNDYERLIQNPQLKNYFSASEAFNNLLNTVMNAVNETLSKNLN